jgi:hypothetical protein
LEIGLFTYLTGIPDGFQISTGKVSLFDTVYSRPTHPTPMAYVGLQATNPALSYKERQASVYGV